jgi:transcriptional regulator with GAF, ATPase, and Fis domain
MTRQSSPEGRPSVGSALDALGAVRLEDHSMQSLLQQTVHLAHEALPGGVDASITLMHDGRAATAVSSGRLALDLDQCQYERGDGPCMQAAARHETVEIPDMRTDDRWPDFLDGAVARGCLSSLSVPLPLHEGIDGALNLYAHEPQAFDQRSKGFAERFASYAAVAAGNMLVVASTLSRVENLQAALASRAVIDQAKGILMERYKITADAAFRRLVKASMDTNTKVRDIAHLVVESGEVPAGRGG